jgi:outer membrane protein OmpA-like peptidoglycan-associated protein
MKRFIFLSFLIVVISIYSLSFSRNSYIDIPTANFDEGIFININGNYPIKTESDVKFDPNIGIEFFYRRINAAVKWYNGVDFAFDLSYQLITENKGFALLTIGVNDLTYKKYISSIGSNDETYKDEKYLPRPPEIASVYLVASKKLNENIELTAGIGRGRFIGYGPNSRYFNYDILFDEKHENLVLGLFGALKYSVSENFSFIIEGDGRDANLGVLYETDKFKGTLGLTKAELIFIEGEELLAPRIDVNLSMKFPEIKKLAKGELEIYIYDMRTKEPLKGNVIINDGDEKVLKVSTKGKLSYEVDPGTYMMLFNSPDYIDKSLKLSITSNEKKNLLVGLIRKYKIIDEEEIEKAVEKISMEDMIEGVNVKFQFNEAEFPPYFHSILDRIVEILEENKNMNLMIIGHTDSVGAYYYNQMLSEERALAVKKYFIDKGISEYRLIAKGYGKTKPIADNGTESGRADNRRVELIIVSSK